MWPFGQHRHISEQDLGDLHGKVAIVTGGYSGIGYCTVQFLARKGAKVYLVTRNEEGTKAAMEKLEEEGINDGSLHWLKIELDNPRSAKNAAEEFLKKEDRLDILIKIFPVLLECLQLILCNSYLGHFILTENLLPLLIKTAEQEDSDVRIINVSSRGHTMVSPASFIGKDNFNKSYGTSWLNNLFTYGLCSFFGFMKSLPGLCLTYLGLSKLANILHTKHLQRRLNDQKVDIICMAIHPGAVVTTTIQQYLDSRSAWSRTFFRALLHIIFVPRRQGAMNSAYTAASPEVKSKAEAFKAAYVDPVGKIVNPSASANDERLANELYNTTLEILKELKI
ncbi:hypothetical protein AN958_01895 [Leucoagaricus sp. SymC.cos]|nr:hypothetical protein AN958_01895 [Leucoagaricus sp. SymC.cos]